MDVYFIAPQKNRPSLFGCPLVIPCTAGTKNSDLYFSVWQQISRFVSAPSPGDDLCSNRLVTYAPSTEIRFLLGLRGPLQNYIKYGVINDR
jgi:hypothetical protein